MGGRGAVCKGGNNQAVRLPKDMEFEDVSELEIIKIGEVITLRPIRPSWQSLSTLPQADADFLQDRPTVIGDEGRFEL